MLFRLCLVASEMMMISIYPFLGCSVFCTVPVGHEDLPDGPRFYSSISSHIVAVALEVDDRLLTLKSIGRQWRCEFRRGALWKCLGSQMEMWRHLLSLVQVDFLFNYHQILHQSCRVLRYTISSNDNSRAL